MAQIIDQTQPSLATMALIIAQTWLSLAAMAQIIGQTSARGPPEKVIFEHADLQKSDC